MILIADLIGLCGVLLAAFTALCLIIYIMKSWGLLSPEWYKPLKWVLPPAAVALISRLIIIAFIAVARSYRAGSLSGILSLDSAAPAGWELYIAMLSNIGFIIGCIVIYRAQSVRKGNEAAIWAVILICVSPFTLFLSLARLSNLAFPLLALAYLMKVKEKPLWSALCFNACVALDPRFVWLIPVLQIGRLKKADILLALSIIIAGLRGLRLPIFSGSIFAASYSTTTMFSIFIPLMTWAVISPSLCALLVRKEKPALLTGAVIESMMPFLTSVLVPMPAFSLPFAISGTERGRRIYLLLSLIMLGYITAQWAFFAPLLPAEVLP